MLGLLTSPVGRHLVVAAVGALALAAVWSTAYDRGVEAEKGRTAQVERAWSERMRTAERKAQAAEAEAAEAAELLKAQVASVVNTARAARSSEQMCLNEETVNALRALR